MDNHSFSIASVCPVMKLADPVGNLQTIESWTRRAAQSGATLVLFPELFITGYMGDEMDSWPQARQDRFRSLAESIPGPATQKLVEFSRALRIFICASLLEREDDQLYNTQVMISPDNGCIGRYRKVHVAKRERWFSTSGNDFPVFDVAGVKMGVLICRDKSFPEAARILALRGAEVLLNPHSTTVSPPGRKFIDRTSKLLMARAIENGCYLIANNNIFDASSLPPERQGGYNFAIDPYGEVIHSDDSPGDVPRMTLIHIDIAVVRERRDQEGISFNLWSRRPSSYSLLAEPHAPFTSSRHATGSAIYRQN